MNYTLQDHQSRGADIYALGKYEITFDWIVKEGINETGLVNLGCGAGDFNLLAVEKGFSVRAYEPDPSALALARKLAAGRSEVQLFEGGVSVAHSQEKNAALLVMHDVIEHIENDKEAVEAIREILRPGGVGVFSVPALSFLFGYHDEQLGHYRRYSMKDFLLLFDEGFEVLDARWYGFSFIPITFLFSVFLRKPYPSPTGKKGLVYFIMCILVWLEKRIRFPLGTALILMVRKR
jgi:SAM-dependent methyltransferase